MNEQIETAEGTEASKSGVEPVVNVAIDLLKREAAWRRRDEGKGLLASDALGKQAAAIEYAVYILETATH